MRFIIVFLALLAIVAAVPQLLKQKAADHDLLQKQEDAIHLFENISGEILDERLYKLGLDYDLEKNLQYYKNPNVVKYYSGAVKSGHIQPKFTTFSTSISKLRKEVTLLTQILLSAKNYDTFIKTAAWARIHVNQEQFVEAFSRAIIQRQDTNGIILPPPYEVFPNYFFDSRIIQKVYDCVHQFDVNISAVNNPVYDIVVNYSSYFRNDENKVAHFTEDIGLSTYYKYVELASYICPNEYHKPYHNGVRINENQYNIGRGAQYYYIHQQLLARYNLERLSCGIGPIENIEYEHIKIPYKPHIRYINGLEFPARSEDVYINDQHHNVELVKLVHTLENRIFEAIDSGHVITPEGTFLSLYKVSGLNILGELIEGSGRSVNPRYYGSLHAVSRQLLGAAPQFHNIYEYAPSALELGQTTVRDPAFYKLFARILRMFRHYQKSLPAYQYNDVVVPGVKIEKVDVSDLVTYFDNYKVALDNIIVKPIDYKHRYPKIQGCLKRLDHKPYEFTIYIHSEKNIPNAVIRIFVGPKYNFEGQPIDINEHRYYFVEVDQFLYNLVEGRNTVVRNSQNASGQSYDWFSIHDIKEHIKRAVMSQSPFYITEPQQYYGFPARLVLPKGTKEGYPLQFLFVISTAENQVENYGPVVPDQWQSYNSDHYHIVTPDEYQEQSVQFGDSNRGQQYVEIIPEYEGDRAVTEENWNWGYLYKKHPEIYSYPHWQQWRSHNTNSDFTQGQQKYGYILGQQPIEEGKSSHNQYGQYEVGNKSHVHYREQQVHHDEVVSEPNNAIIRDAAGRNYQGGNDPGHNRYGSEHYYGTDSYGTASSQTVHDRSYQYYNAKFIGDIIGGVISLDGKPLGFPLDRPLAHSVFYAHNIYIKNVPVYHHEDLSNNY